MGAADPALAIDIGGTKIARRRGRAGRAADLLGADGDAAAGWTPSSSGGRWTRCAPSLLAEQRIDARRRPGRGRAAGAAARWSGRPAGSRR